jgi:hypothetical protein
MGLSHDDVPYVSIPLKTVIKLTPHAYGCHENQGLPTKEAWNVTTWWTRWTYYFHGPNGSTEALFWCSNCTKSLRVFFTKINSHVFLLLFFLPRQFVSLQNWALTNHDPTWNWCFLELWKPYAALMAKNDGVATVSKQFWKCAYSVKVRVPHGWLNIYPSIEATKATACSLLDDYSSISAGQPITIGCGYFCCCYYRFLHCLHEEQCYRDIALWFLCVEHKVL